ncbi:MAG: hypothetical protein IJP74_09820 [Prevotella sp.]|nr:hypothetical protein [Prevotella sp.]
MTQTKGVTAHRRGGAGVRWLYGLTFVPSLLLWLFLLDEHALLGGWLI